MSLISRLWRLQRDPQTPRPSAWHLRGAASERLARTRLYLPPGPSSPASDSPVAPKSKAWQPDHTHLDPHWSEVGDVALPLATWRRGGGAIPAALLLSYSSNSPPSCLLRPVSGDHVISESCDRHPARLPSACLAASPALQASDRVCQRWAYWSPGGLPSECVFKISPYLRGVRFWMWEMGTPISVLSKLTRTPKML